MVKVERELKIAEALKSEIAEINKTYGTDLYVKYQDWHDDGEIDEYGTYRIVSEDKGFRDSIGGAMNISEFDQAVCSISDLLEYLEHKEMIRRQKKEP